LADNGSELAAGIEIAERPYGWLGTFSAMASPCEVHIAGADRTLALRTVRSVAGEARRIEQKFSRYVEGNIVDLINRSEGEPVSVDEETARLLDYASELHTLSEGRFDITSGILRRVWRFDGGSEIPSKRDVNALLDAIGWHRVVWQRPTIRLEKSMQIDLGGIGKEYAVDRAAALAEQCGASCLVNFGGDLRAQGAGPDGLGWLVGIEAIKATQGVANMIRLRHGGIATSGDTYRYLIREGKRYGHILDPTTGWPVEDAPRSVTVAADTCTEAGMLATFAMLHGANAETFLSAQGVRFWCMR